LNDPVGLYGQRYAGGIWNQERNAILTTATWNVRSMLQTGKMVEITDEARKLKINILAIQETLAWTRENR
jgi:hypothetical protein